jgi:hypothetical protein
MVQQVVVECFGCEKILSDKDFTFQHRVNGENVITCRMCSKKMKDFLQVSRDIHREGQRLVADKHEKARKDFFGEKVYDTDEDFRDNEELGRKLLKMQRAQAEFNESLAAHQEEKARQVTGEFKRKGVKINSETVRGDGVARHQVGKPRPSQKQINKDKEALSANIINEASLTSDSNGPGLKEMVGPAPKEIDLETGQVLER